MIPVDPKQHPLVKYGSGRGWGYEKTAKHFRMSYGDFRQIVTGWAGVSFKRAKRWELRSKGAFRATDIIEWHGENRREKGVAA